MQKLFVNFFLFLINFLAKLKEKLEELYANNNKDKSKSDFIYQCLEYLTLKIYFSIPLFPIFKKMTLRKDFNFSDYLKICLIEKLRNLFKFSWTCLINALFVIIFWHVLIAPLALNLRVKK